MAQQNPFNRSDFEQLLDGIQSALHAYIISLLGPEADSDDVLQETNRFLCERWRDFDPGTSFRTWTVEHGVLTLSICHPDTDDLKCIEHHLLREDGTLLFLDCPYRNARRLIPGLSSAAHQMRRHKKVEIAHHLLLTLALEEIPQQGSVADDGNLLFPPNLPRHAETAEGQGAAVFHFHPRFGLA